MRATSRSVNKFCNSSDLTNEASVESFFVLRMLSDLGYVDREIMTKAAIQRLRIPMGRKRELYKPDFILSIDSIPRWLIEAKAVDEKIEDYTHQCASYALLINRKYKARPLKHYMLTNGILTRVYPWDQEEAVLSLRFDDFQRGNPKFEALKQLLQADTLRAEQVTPARPSGGHKMERPPLETVKKPFSNAIVTSGHQRKWGHRLPL